MILIMILIIGILFSFFKDKILFTKIYLFLISLLSVFRYGTGADYFAYKYLYANINSSLFNELFNGIGNQEYGFKIISFVLNKIHLPFEIYLAIFSLISLFFIYKLSIKYSKNPCLSLTVFYSFYYFIWIFSGIRQGLVIPVGIYCLFETLENKKELKFLIITILLSTIHLSAFVLLVYYFLIKMNFDRKTISILLIISIGVNLLPIKQILILFSISFPFISRILPYIQDAGTSLLDFKTTARLVFALVVLLFYVKYIKMFPKQKKLLDLYLIGFIIYFVFKFSEGVASRLAIYGKYLDFIILVNIIYIIRNQKNKFAYSFCFIVLLFSYFVKESNTMTRQSGLIQKTKYLPKYVNIYNKKNYSFNNKYIYLIE